MIHIILLEPEHAGNIGAVARVMKNFSFTQLVLVNPKVDITQETRNRAKHAQDVLDHTFIVDDCFWNSYDILVGTTGKLGSDYNMTRTPIMLADLAQRLHEANNSKTKIGIIIGRESSGMLNEELERCDLMTTIPANSVYPILNISHAVGIILYELHKCFATPLEETFIPAKRKEKEQALKYIDEILSHMHFATENKLITQQKLWKRLVTKSFLTKREIFAFLGFLRKIQDKLKKE